jgi:tetratricopeptide (TPR) repeat protein
MVLRPAEVDIAGIQHLAVVDFAGQGETGREARAALTARLAEKQHYALVDQAELSRVEPAAFTGPQIDESRVVGAARQAQIDGLLTGQVVAYDAGAGSTLVNPPTVTLAVKLIDVASGQVRDARQITRTFKSREVSDRQTTLHGLMAECADEMAARITPHQELVNVELARQYWGVGLADVHRGNVLARESKWPEAAAAWQAALDKNPKNHVAMHNLAIAAFARGDYAKSRDQLDKAITQFADATYQQNRKVLTAQQKLADLAIAQTRPAPSGGDRVAANSLAIAPSPHAPIGSPPPPQILPAAGPIIPAAIQTAAPLETMPQRLPQP